MNNSHLKGKAVKVVFHEDFYQAYTSDPAAESGRMESIVNAIRPCAEFITAKPAPHRDITAVHTTRHIQYVERQGLYDIAALAAGGAIQSARIGLSEPCFGLIRPPGHHASADSSWGFCFFSNMAVALETLHREGEIESACVLDIDLHFGDGTDDILGRRKWATVVNFNSHSRSPYMDEVADVLKNTRVDLIGVSAGFDNHRADWGGLLRTEDYQEIGYLVRSAADRNGGGCFAILEGGYNHKVLGENVLALIRGMGG
jgi:acetoin utilization deacetylase AcuC-like enzyme